MTTTIPTPDPEDPFTGAKVLDFPAPTKSDTDPAANTAPDVVNGTVESVHDTVHGDDQHDTETPVLVDTPAVADDRSLVARLNAARTGTRRPVIAPWLASREEFVNTARWALGHAGHTMAYHAVRCPVYAAKLAARSPRGLFRGIGVTANWWLDAEGRALRSDAVNKGDAETYIKLKNVKPRGRGWVVLLGLCVLTAGTLVLFGYAPAGHRFSACPPPSRCWAGWAATPTGPWSADAPWSPPRRRNSPATSWSAPCPHSASPRSTRPWARAGAGSPSRPRSPATAPAGAPRSTCPTAWWSPTSWSAGTSSRPACGAPWGVWPEPVTEEHAGRLVLWVGDQDMSQAKTGAWTLAKSGQADIFKPLPFGQDQRGRAVAFLLMFANLLIGAMPRQGKTFALRIVLLAAALDPTVQLRIFELKGTGDLSGPGEKCAHHYGTGADDDTLAACLASLREIKAELDTRAKTIRELPREVCPENKVTPELARRKGLGLHPVVFAIDECQELFSHPELGKEAEALCVPIIKRGPALGIMLVLATQRPDAKSLPPAVADNMSLRFCLRVMGQVANDMVLGTSAYKNGIRATMFGHKDKGIGLLVGNADDPQIVRSAYVDGPQADKISERARAMRAAAGTLTGHAAGEETLASAANDGPNLLADICEVLPAGQDKVWSETVVDRLADLRPEVYGPWAEQDGKTKATQLAAALKPYGITTSQVWAAGPDGKNGNRRGITRADVIDAYRATRPDRNFDGE
ncbi:FtsK/SpoIIIE domain-containing protein [Kibdelosporangium lantanae]